MLLIRRRVSVESGGPQERAKAFGRSENSFTELGILGRKKKENKRK